jgi:uncharacterized protein
MDHLKQNVALARHFTPIPEAEQTALLDRVCEAAGDGRYELFTTTRVFDGPSHRRQHQLDVTRA